MEHASESPVTGDVRLGDIPSSLAAFDISTTGIKIARFFEDNPDSPGVMISRDGKCVSAISQTDFLRVISRQFGSELFYRRPIQAVIEHLHNKRMLMLPSDSMIHEAMDRCLDRDKNEMFGPFLVEDKSAGEIKMVDFRTLTLASSSVLATRNRQLAAEMKARKLLEQKLLRAQRMETVGLLAGGIAHNLNNTLAPIMMAASMLNQDLPEGMHDEFTRTIEVSVKRASEIIEQLLAFSRGLDGRRNTFSPRLLVGEVEKFAGMTFSKSITITTLFGAGLRNITGDQTQLHQVLLNLCINARDAMPGGGEIRIAAENCDIDEDNDLLPHEAAPGPYIKLSVSDSGCGIPPEFIEKVFDPFFTTKGVGKGTGLGLSTAVGIVQSHDGFMKVSSKVGAGTKFTVFLPATETPAGDCAAKPSNHIPKGRGEMILVVDDEDHIRKTAEWILKENGYKVATSINGDEALSVYGKQKIDLVLTDIMMPVMDGVELTRNLKMVNPVARIIVSSGRIDRNHESTLAGLGVNERLWKPYRADQLLKAIHDRIHEKNLGSGHDAALRQC
jgi:signal transduction histidine kinase/ActR/RegA family two-component response regulator